MTVYRLYLRSRVRREFRWPANRFDATAGRSPPPGRQERATMIYDYWRYSYLISGIEEFEAEDDTVALDIARSIHDAATDVCDAFELWDGTRHIDQSIPATREKVAPCADTQERMIATEEALLNGDWTIAQSPRLRARFAALRDEAVDALLPVPVAT